MPHQTTVHRLFERARLSPQHPAYFTKVRGTWRATTYAEYAGEVKRAANALIALGLAKGSSVAILGFNCPEWVVADLAAMAIGGSPAGIYTTSSGSEARFIVEHARAEVLFVESEKEWNAIARDLETLASLKHVVVMHGPAPSHRLAMTWQEFLDKGTPAPPQALDQRLDALEPDGLATLIYTSGTTGPPKGVMLSHRNLTWTADVAQKLVEIVAGDRTLSYLPLSHVAEQIFTIHGPIAGGSTVYFAESMERVADNLKEVAPTIFFGVPRIWEKMHRAIEAKLASAPPAKKRIAEQAMRIGRQWTDLRNEGRQPGAWLRAQHALMDRLVYSKLKAAIGLQSAKVCVSGAAPIAKEVLEFFASLDVVVQEVYGQSEDTGPTTFNRPGKIRFGTVGPIFPGVEVRIAEDGEVLVRGPNVFLGYYRDPAATAETIIDGWLHSGDLGELDADGFLRITGRKKDILITAGGKNIAPQNIELALRNHPLIAEAVVIGDRRKFLSALIVVDSEAATKLGSDSRAPHESRAVEREIQKAVDEVNETLARVERIKKFCILPRPLSLEEGELTPTLKLKRNVVSNHFAAQIEAMYEDANA